MRRPHSILLALATTLALGLAGVGHAQGTLSYTVGGKVGGLTAGTVTLLDNGGDALPVSANGTFVFPTALNSGSPYSVSVGTQPAGQNCVVGQHLGTIGSASVTSVTVSCSALP